MIIARARHPERLLAAVALLAGLAAWIVYLNEGLVLTHYDAKAHLVVARRVIDSLTPGWQQIGAVWLPLPHLIQILPTQIDVFYRTGAFGSLVSIACFGIAAWAMARLVLSMTGSTLGAVDVGGAARPQSEPALPAVHADDRAAAARGDVALGALAVRVADRRRRLSACRRRSDGRSFCTAWTRYEAWPILAAALAAAAFALWRRGRMPLGVVARRIWRLARWPAAAVALFLRHQPPHRRRVVRLRRLLRTRSRPTTGRPCKTLLAVWWGTHRLSGYVIEIVGAGSGAAVVVAMRAAIATRQPTARDRRALRRGRAPPTRSTRRIRFASATWCRSWRRARCSAGSRSGCSAVEGRSAYRRSGPTAWLLAALLIASTLIESPPWSRERAADRRSAVGRRQQPRARST